MIDILGYLSLAVGFGMIIDVCLAMRRVERQLDRIEGELFDLGEAIFDEQEAIAARQRHRRHRAQSEN